MKVTVFSSTGCGYCKQLKDFLEDKGVDYQERVIDESEQALEEMQKEADGFMGTPFTVIEKEGSKEKIKGFDRRKFKEVLGIE